MAFSLSLQRPRNFALRLIAAMVGAAILYHEVVLAETAEVLPVVLGLWFMGVPPALFLDGLRKVTNATTQAIGEVGDAINAESETPALRRRDDEPGGPSEDPPT